MVNAVVVGGAGALAAYWWVRRSGSGGRPAVSVAAWYETTATLAEEVQRVTEDSTTVADHDDLQRTLLPLAGRIRAHARAAPDGVDPADVQALFDLGVACHTIGLEHTRGEGIRTGEFLEDKLASLADQAASLEAAATDHA